MLPIQKLESLSARFAELEELLCQPHVLSDAKKYTELSRERAELTELVRVFARLRELQKRLEDDRVALGDPELKELAEMEIPELERELAELSQALNILLLPTDPNDVERQTILKRMREASKAAAANMPRLLAALAR